MWWLLTKITKTCSKHAKWVLERPFNSQSTQWKPDIDVPLTSFPKRLCEWNVGKLSQHFHQKLNFIFKVSQMRSQNFVHDCNSNKTIHSPKVNDWSWMIVSYQAWNYTSQIGFALNREFLTNKQATRIATSTIPLRLSSMANAISEKRAKKLRKLQNWNSFVDGIKTRRHWQWQQEKVNRN